jgi:hypothetical protein
MAALFNTTTNTTNLLNTAYTGSATQVITVMAWFFTTSTTPNNYRDIVTLDPNIYMQLQGGVNSDFGTANNDHLGPVLAINTWYHLCQVVVPTATTSRQIYGYINGQLQVNVTDGDTSVAYTNVCVGSSIFSGETFPLNGSVRDVRIWTRQLPLNEIVDEMESKVPVHRAALLLWSPFDDGTAQDKSGNGRTWTVGSAVTLAPGPIPTWIDNAP